MGASCDAFLLLTVSIALQNELDNTRALLSQKGEFPEALGRSPEEGKGFTLQYSGLENCMDYIVHGVEKS